VGEVGEVDELEARRRGAESVSGTGRVEVLGPARGREENGGTEEMRRRSEGLQLVSRDFAVLRLSEVASRESARMKEWE
jgi:hypothetical protein